MDNDSAVTGDTDRLHLVDALRGFALAGIVVVHFMEQYLGEMPPPGHDNYARHWPIDGALDAIIFILIRGKGFALFSFMFGLSFALQMHRAGTRDSGADFRPRFAWRLLILFGMGWLHSLLYRGDILMIYAVLGLPLMLFHRVPDRWLWALALVLMLGAPRVVMHFASPRPTPADLKAFQTVVEDRATRHYQALKQRGAGEIARLNATEGMVSRMLFQFGPFARGYQTFAYFLLGLWAGRRRLFEDVERYRPALRRTARWTGAVSLGVPVVAGVLALLARLFAGGAPQSPEAPRVFPDFTSWPFIAGFGFYDLWNFTMSVFYVTAFVLLFQRERWRQRLLGLAPVGRMALTSYLVQSLLGAAIFYGLGFGALGAVGNAITLPLGLALFWLQMRLSRVWLQRFQYGPLEWAWRSLTFLQAQPFRRAAPVPRVA